MNILWLIIGIIYSALSVPYFWLAWKARQKVSLKNIQLDRLSEKPFIPKGNVGLSVTATIDENGFHSAIKSHTFKPLIAFSNSLAEGVEKHLNSFIFPRLKQYLDETSLINTTGFIVAGVLSVIASIIAFLIAFLVI